jgi:transcriptional regulator with XRE-family HTH domain
MDDRKAIGARIKQARDAKDLTQVELAVAIGVSRAHLTNAENGKVGLSLDKLSGVATETGTTVAWLIGEVGPIDPLEAEISAIIRVIDQRDRESLVRIARTFKQGPTPPPATPPPKPKGGDLRPFRVGGSVTKKVRHSALCVGCDRPPPVAVPVMEA